MSVEEIYANIGQSIKNAVQNDQCSYARLHINIEGAGVVGYTGDYQIGEATHDMSVRNMPREIRTWLRDLHAITTEGGNNRWNQAVFTLAADGKFDMKFIWNQALHDEIESLAKV